jgi:hypothetical protein
VAESVAISDQTRLHAVSVPLLLDPTFGVPGTITRLDDTWLDEGRLSDHMKAVPK